MIRINRSILVLVIVAVLPLRINASAQATNPPYISQFPSVERVKAEIKGSDPVDTSVRQLVALIRLRIIIEDLAHARLENKLTPDESRLSSQYSDARRWYNEHPPSPADRDRWFTLEGRYLQDDRFRDELLRRFFSPEFRTAYYRVTRKQPPQPASEQPNTPAVTPADYSFAMGVTLQKEKKYGPAIEAYEKAIALEPNSKTAALAHKAIGMIHNDQERYREAVLSLRESLRLGVPSPYIVSKELGFAYYKLERYQEAVPAIQQAISAKPDYAEAYYLLGWTYVKMGKRDDALQAYRTLERVDKTYDAHKLYEAINQMSAAAPNSNAPSSGAANADAYIAQGDKYYAAKDYPKAIEAYKKAISLDPSSDTYNILGNTYLALEQYPEAVAAFQHATRLDPKNASYRESLGYTYLFMGKIEEESRVSQELEKINPLKAKGLERDIRVTFKGVENDPEKLITLGRESVSLPGSVDVANAILPIFRRVIVLNKDPESVADAYREIGKIYRKLARLAPQKDAKASAAFQQAVAFYQQTIRLQTGNADAHFNLGDTYVRLGRKQEAQQVYKTLLKLNKKKAQELLDEINNSR